MKLEGAKLVGILQDIGQSREVSMYYKRYLMREGYITRVKKPVSGRGRPGFMYDLTAKAVEILNALHRPRAS